MTVYVVGVISLNVVGLDTARQILLLLIPSAPV